VIGKGAPRGCEGGFLLIRMKDLYLVIAGKSNTEGKKFMSSTRINDLVDEGSA
jgi:hypothetical protein